MRAVYTYRGAGPAPDVEYEPWDVVFSAKRGYLVHTLRGNWEPLVIPADPSDRGPAGADGRPGRNGVDGRTGRDGIAGPMGPRGERGEKGDKGERGERGFRGEDGGSGLYIKRESSNVVTAVADGVVTLGDVIRVSGPGIVTRAIASGSDDEALAVGIVTEVEGTQVKYVTAGPVQVPGPLSPGAVYYLSTTVPGGMTTTFPNTIGDHVVILGAATSVDALNLKIDWALVIGS